MKELLRGLSFVMLTYEGGPLRFNVPFPYIAPEHVRAFVGEPDSARLVPVSWINSNTIEIPSQDGILTAPYTVTIRRVTPIDKPVVDFRNGANLPARDLNKALTQLLYAQQEGTDSGKLNGGLPGGSNPGDYNDINVIIDQVLRSAAMQQLLTRIDLIDMNAETILEDIMRSHDYFETKRNYGDKITMAFTEITTLHQGADEIARQYTELFARVRKNEVDSAASYVQLNEAVANEKQARITALTELQAQFTDSTGKVSAALNQRIDTVVVDTNSAIAQSAQKLGAEIDDKVAQTSKTITAEVDAVKSRVSDTETAIIKHGDNIAGLLTTTEGLVTAEGANTAFRQALSAKYGNNVGGGIANEIDGKIAPVSAAFDQEIKAEASAREALASKVTTLQVNTAPTFFSSKEPTPPAGGFQVPSYWVKTGQTGAYLSYVWDGSKWLQADVDTSSPTGALIKDIQQTKIDSVQASAIASTQLQAFKDGAFASLQQQYSVTAGKTDSMYGQWQAEWSLKINGGTLNGQPVIAGIALSANQNTGSDFVVMADRFAVVHPQYTSGGTLASVKAPFVVGVVGGLSTVGIQGQLLVDGSITADKIRVNTLSAITANMGTVNGGTFRTYNLDGNGNIIDPNEFRVEMTNQGWDYPLWVGAGVKNWNNAVFAVDRAGNAKFGGTVTAPNIVGNLQVVATWEWSGDISAVGGATSSFALNAPIRVGESHTPIVMIEFDYYNSGGDPCNGVVRVDKLIGGTWVTIREKNYYLGSRNSDNRSYIILDGATTGAIQYRLSTASGGNRDGNFHVTYARAYAFGLR